MANVDAEFPEKLEMLFAKSRYKVSHGGRGSSKCLGLGTKILMYDGTLSKVEDVKVNDRVMGPDSKPRTVLSVTSGESELFKIKQTSAIDYVVNEDHVLSLKKSKACSMDRGIMPSGNPRRPNGRYPSWPHITNIPIKKYLEQSHRWKDNFRGYRAGCFDFPAQTVSIDPYLLGLWLGDGLHRELMITSADYEIADWLRGYAIFYGVGFSESKKSGQSNKAKDYRLTRIPHKHGRENPLWQEFKKLNLVSNKHIPQKYITNSRDIRLKLLAGLIDTDGTYISHGYSITSANKTLAHGIKRLVDSLGFRSSIKKRKTQCGDFRGVAWSISINGDTWGIPCLIERKKYKHNGIKPNKDKTLSYLNIEAIGVGEYAGFTVDKDHLFCLEDGTVTHNSWSFARALLILGAQSKLRILCAREVQDSIKQSVHKLLKDQIQLLGLGGFYEVLETEIRGRNGTEIAFAGLSSLTVESIKSYEGYDICWVEEGQTISDASWVILIPTIRKDGSEIWVSYNPSLETDPTHDRFVMNPPEDCIVVEMNWRDNPWFNDVMNKERLHCLATDPEGYKNIWDGQCKPAVEGAIYYKEIQQAEKDKRICNIPYDPMLKVHVVLDLGWGDSLAVSLVQKNLSEIRIFRYFEYSKTKLDVMSAELKMLRYNWGLVWLPHDGFAGSLNSDGKTTYDILTKLGWVCAVRKAKKRSEIEIVELSIEDGIRNARLKFGQLYFDQSWTCAKLDPLPPEGHTLLTNRLMECVKRYRRKINKQTGAETSPVHDEYSHGADNLRYICANADKMTNEDIKPKKKIFYPGYSPLDDVVGI